MEKTITVTQEAQETCPTCKGSGKMKLEVHEAGKVTNMEIDCIDCDGTGKVTKAVAKSIQRSKDIWCKCGNPSSESDYHPDTPNSKHHYTCADCGKVTQVG